MEYETSYLLGKVDELLAQLTLKEKISLLAGKDVWNTVAINRLGIRHATMSDGPNGVRASFPEADRQAGPTTAFPTGVAFAASWDPELVEKLGSAIAEETLAMGCDIILGPCVNIVRHPLAGRNFESYGEDPYLAGQIGIAYVKGVQSKGVGTSLKHFACNNQEYERFRGDSCVNERTLREIYLAQFETIVKEAKPWTVMCSYNRVNGAYASQNHHTLTEILKNEWGFEGAVVSDWNANHTIFESILGGLDLEMPGPAKYYGSLLMDAVNNWQIEEETVNQAARRVLLLLARLGKLDLVSTKKIDAGSVNSLEHQRLACKSVEESITLLKNEGSVLPLEARQIKSLAVIGMNAARYTTGGGGSSIVTSPYVISPLDGLKAQLGDAVSVCYEPGCNNFDRIPTLRPEWLLSPEGEPVGLKGEFFSSSRFEGTPALVRFDRKMDFWWFSEGPVNSKKFSIHWKGQLVVPETGRYVFTVLHTAKVRVLIDQQMLVENTAGEQIVIQPACISQSIYLSGGQAHTLEIEYFKDTEDEVSQMVIQCAYMPLPEEDRRLERAVDLARSCDAVVICAGTPDNFETEGEDRPYLELPGGQNELIRAVTRVNPKTVVVLNVGAPVSMPWLDDIPAVVLSYFGGMEAGNAIASVLLGEVNPSGKLPVTFPRRIEDTPAYINYPGGRQVHYGEGIFVGYRHYDQKDVEPLFPFGHGLSYSTFKIDQLEVPPTVRVNSSWRISVNLTNTGSRPGKEVVQLYVRDVKSSVARPQKELKGFKKVSLLPGESKVVSFDLDDRSLAFYDILKNNWTVEPGVFEILIGTSSREIHQRKFIQVETT
jgi:beta-glucosidase